VDRREQCQRKLRSRRIESAQTHFRNDRYSVFDCNEEFPAMDSIDDSYLILPLHTRMSLADVDRICDVLKEGW
jgi:perosamine synthetase